MNSHPQIQFRSDLEAADKSDVHLFPAKLMEHLAIAAFALDRFGRVVMWNKACERLTGFSSEEMIGGAEHWKAFYSEKRPCLADLLLAGLQESSRTLYAAWPETKVNPDGVSAENWCVMPRLGRRCYLGFDVGPIYDDRGNLIAVVETLRDLTAHKVAETELQTLAGVDSLTSIANRRIFDQRLEQEWRRVTRRGPPLSLLLIDVDHFKAYNDHYGHLNGDKCLRALAKCMKRHTTRDTDLAARFGGEEFAILLPYTSASGAMAVATRIRRAIEDARIRHDASPTSAFVTVSIGVMTSHDGLTAQEFVAKADAALYAAKSIGRNRILPHSGDVKLPNSCPNVGTSPQSDTRPKNPAGLAR